jgi:nitrate/TMAO reductase-like tetraheme cytochrome c subunit
MYPMKKAYRYFLAGLLIILFTGTSLTLYQKQKKYAYKDFQTPEYCNQCHILFYNQWDQSLMSDAYNHEWDEIEYFDLAVAHSRNDTSMRDVHEGCNGCHTPMAYLVGDMPPPDPKTNPRANESVSCEVCHSITGFSGEVPFNHNYDIQLGDTKFTTRKGETSSPNHEIEATEIHGTAEFCGICHNEKSPFGIWVKSTHLELQEGPYYKEGVVCQDCHMPDGPSKTAIMGSFYEDTRMHLFNGAHDPGKIRGVIEIRIAPDRQEVVPGEKVVFTITLFNQKTGHKFPTGSVEDRIVWLHVEAVDEGGNVYHIPVDKKGFEGEEYTIAGDALAYQDMAIPLGLDDFQGIRREDVPVGDRIFRMPYFDPQGRMTIMQWNTASLGVDYRIGPRETKIETYSFNLPYDIIPGKLTIRAVMNYRLLVKPVGEFLKVPEEEYRARTINEQETQITVYP